MHLQCNTRFFLVFCTSAVRKRLFVKLTRFHELHLPQQRQQISICLREKECSHFSQQEVLHFTKTIKKSQLRTHHGIRLFVFTTPYQANNVLSPLPVPQKLKNIFKIGFLLTSFAMFKDLLETVVFIKKLPIIAPKPICS